jgi:hypothetical protein
MYIESLVKHYIVCFVSRDAGVIGGQPWVWRMVYPVDPFERSVLGYLPDGDACCLFLFLRFFLDYC